MLLYVNNSSLFVQSRIQAEQNRCPTYNGIWGEKFSTVCMSLLDPSPVKSEFMLA